MAKESGVALSMPSIVIGGASLMVLGSLLCFAIFLTYGFRIGEDRCPARNVPSSKALMLAEGRK